MSCDVKQRRRRRAVHRRVLALFFARWRKNVNLVVMKQKLRRLF
jgi:hypothetical protein